MRAAAAGWLTNLVHEHAVAGGAQLANDLLLALLARPHLDLQRAGRQAGGAALWVGVRQAGRSGFVGGCAA